MRRLKRRNAPKSKGAEQIFDIKPKQPWEMKRGEFVNWSSAKTGLGAGQRSSVVGLGTHKEVWERAHKVIIKKTLSEGNLPPEEAIKLHKADYPDIESWDEFKKAGKQEGKEPWEMTSNEFLEQNKRRVIKSGVDADEIDQNQIELWKQNHIRAIADSPRNADIPVKVLKSLPETARESLLQTHPIAALNWVDSLKIWNKPYRKVLADVQIRAGIGDIKKMHRKAISQALSEGKPVPEKVLKDYPDLTKKYAKKGMPSEEAKPTTKPKQSWEENTIVN